MVLIYAFETSCRVRVKGSRVENMNSFGNIIYPLLLEKKTYIRRKSIFFFLCLFLSSEMIKEQKIEEQKSDENSVINV